jgi:hypothetical protein
MLRSPRISFLITSLTVLYAVITTLFILSGSIQSGWLNRLFLPATDNNASAPFHEQHALSLKQDCALATVTETKAIASFQTLAPIAPGPAYCNECGKDDVLCREYGYGFPTFL